MKKSKLFPVFVLTIASIVGLVGCQKAKNEVASTPSVQNENPSSEDQKSEPIVIKGIADLVPHSELINFVKAKLEAQGIIIELVADSADSTTNEKTALGEIEFNFFQHEPYLKSWNETNGFNLINVGNIHVEPITAYADRYKSVEEIPDNAIVAIPNDGTNEYRALRILEQNGFIRLNEETATSLSASVTDIAEYIKQIEIVELDSAQIIPTKSDYDFFITNTNKALEAKITSNKLFSEDGDNPYANIIVVRSEDKDNAAILALVKELQSEETRKYIEEQYNGAVIPAKLD